MLFKSLTLLLAIGSAMALMPSNTRLNTEQSLISFLLQSRAYTGNSQLNQYCFGRYLPILNAHSEQLEKDYNRCTDTLDREYDQIEIRYEKPRENITETARNTCLALQKCDTHASTVEAFECFEGTGSAQSKILLSLSANSGKYAIELTELRRAAKSICDACTKHAEWVYLESTSDTYADLSACLDGNV
ncbi:hypothetical protein KR222_007501, partial [Zaprionus bogoriensis]